MLDTLTETIHLKEKILIIEDDEDLNRLVKLILEKQNYRVDSALNAERVFELTKSNRYDVVFLDVNLPDMNGYKLFKILKKQFLYTEIIMMTGAPQYSDAVNITKDGAFDYIPKPFDAKKIIDTAARAINARNKLLEDDMEKTAQIEGGFLYGYNFIRNIGSGNMGDVMLVEKNGISFALKQIRPLADTMKSPKQKQKLLDIIEEVAKINHPNIVQIINYGIPNGMLQPFVLMEYIKGSSLSSYIKKDVFSMKEKLIIIKQIASALIAVHNHGIVHRDIKPSNIIINKTNVVKLTDFGISFLEGQTETINLTGSPAYMAPESFENDELPSTKFDIFSLGVLSYELLTGERPFSGSSITTMIHAIRTFTPIAPQKLNPEISDEMQILIMDMLEKNPQRRLIAENVYDKLDGILLNKLSKVSQ